MPIAPNFVRRRLEKGELALGFGVHHLRTPAVGMIAASSGCDWLFNRIRFILVAKLRLATRHVSAFCAICL